VFCVQGVKLSREKQNNVLARKCQNDYLTELKRWNFFRAGEPDELWQMYFKGPFSVQGKKYWFLILMTTAGFFIMFKFIAA
jgi:hypothetical protein